MHIAVTSTSSDDGLNGSSLYQLCLSWKILNNLKARTQFYWPCFPSTVVASQHMFAKNIYIIFVSVEMYFIILICLCMYISLKSIAFLILSCQPKPWGILVNYLWSLFFAILINFTIGSTRFWYQFWEREKKNAAITCCLKSKFQFSSVSYSCKQFICIFSHSLWF